MSSRFARAIDALDAAVRGSSHFRSWLRSRRWCGDAIGMRTKIAIEDRAVLRETGIEAIVLFLAVARESEGPLVIHLPLSVSTARSEPDAFELPVAAQRFYVTEAERRREYARFIADGFHHQQRVRTEAGDSLHFQGPRIPAFRGIGPEVSSDTSNLLVQIDTADRPIVFKSYKLLDVRNREPEILTRLHGKGFRHVPPYLGEVSLGLRHDRVVLGVATEHVDSLDLFSWFVQRWREELAGRASTGVPLEGEGLDLAGRLAKATAELHGALFDRHPGPFQAGKFTRRDASEARRIAIGNLGDALRRLGALAKREDSGIAGAVASARRLLLESRGGIEDALRGLDAGIGTVKGATHGDLHLGQVLWRASDGEVLFIDFEGEPARPSEERSLPLPPLRDVATMVRSFSYVTHYAWREHHGGDPTAAWGLFAREDLTEPERTTADRLLTWERRATDLFTSTYRGHTKLYPGFSETDGIRFLRGWVMEKALYELRYEAIHRPLNALVPLEGVLRLAAASGTAASSLK